jgi:acetyl-CoA decarbonylase/synthase complex subunit gamma
MLALLPGRAFSLKGLIAGLFVLAVILLPDGRWYQLSGMESWCLFFSIPAMAAYLAMNFTGSSTFTSLSGVRKEMRWALPLEMAGTAAGLALWIGSILVGR